MANWWRPLARIKRSTPIRSMGGEPRLVPGVQPDEAPTGWSSDGRTLFVFRYGQIPAQVVEIDIATGQRKPWKQLEPADAAGIDTINGVMMTADAKGYVYGYIRTLCDLYLVEGLESNQSEARASSRSCWTAALCPTLFRFFRWWKLQAGLSPGSRTSVLTRLRSRRIPSHPPVPLAVRSVAHRFH